MLMRKHILLFRPLFFLNMLMAQYVTKILVLFYSCKDLASYKKDAIAVDHTKAWAKMGLQFQFNEFRSQRDLER